MYAIYKQMRTTVYLDWNHNRVQVLTNEFLSRRAEVSDCGRYVVLDIREGTNPVNRLWYCDLEALSEGITGMYHDLKASKNPK